MKKRERDSGPEPPVKRILQPVLSLLACAWIVWLARRDYVRVVLPFGPDLRAARELILDTPAILGAGFAWNVAVLTAFWFVAMRCGDFIRGQLKLDATPAERPLIASGLGMGAISLAMLALGSLGLWSPHILRGLFAAVFAICVLLSVFHKSAPAAQISATPTSTAAAWDPVVASALLLGAVLMAFSTMGPETFYDSLVYHLALPKLYLLNHRIVPTPHNAFSGAPQGVQMLYGLLLAVGDERLTALLNCSFGMGTPLALLCLGRRYASRSTGLLAGLLFLVSPVVLYAGTFSGADLASAFYATLALFAMLRSLQAEPETAAPPLAWSIGAGIFVGLAMSTKYNVFSLGAALILLHFIIGRRAGHSLALAAGAACVVGPWLLKNVLFFSNPFYPFLIGSSRLADWAGFLQAASAQSLKTTFFTKAGWRELILLPWQISQGELAMDNWPGSSFLAFLPWTFLLRYDNLARRALCGAALLGYLAWSLFSHQGRFFVPVLPILAFVIALAIHESAISPALKNAGPGIALFFCAANLAAFSHQNVLMGRWAFWKARGAQSAFLGEEHAGYPAPPFRAIDFVNRHTPSDAKILFVGDARGYYTERDFVAPTVYDRNPLWEIVRLSADGGQIASELRRLGFTHLIVNGRGLFLGSINAVLPPNEVRSDKFREFHAKYLKTLFEDHEARSGRSAPWLFVYEILDSPQDVNRTAFNLPTIVLDARQGR